MNIVPRDVEMEAEGRALAVAESQSLPAVFSGVLASSTSHQLERMFRDPRVLEAVERAELVAQLRSAVELCPDAAELRVLLGMALCVDLQAQQALVELRIAADQAPGSFIAHLKYGELLMRLRICQRAAEETHKAAQLAANAAQSEMARRQAATIRTMLRDGVERGGYGGVLSRVFRFPRRSRHDEAAVILAGIK